ncbi:MAG: hypothetical protein LBL74_07225 [Bacteroidales bacterium]|jgi:hypothetical protein|nr:hypothetical protein [Bacteroidales bacterium]
MMNLAIYKDNTLNNATVLNGSNVIKNKYYDKSISCGFKMAFQSLYTLISKLSLLQRIELALLLCHRIKNGIRSEETI